MNPPKYVFHITPLKTPLLVPTHARELRSAGSRMAGCVFAVVFIVFVFLQSHTHISASSLTFTASPRNQKEKANEEEYAPATPSNNPSSHA